jgi:putative ABC transport system permease protein
VVIVNETMARRFWPDGEALGQRIIIRNETFSREIIGITSDVKHFGLEKESGPEMYVPFDQRVINVMPMVVRVSGDPAQIIAGVREQASAVDPDVAIATLLPMQQRLAGSLAQRRFTMLLLGVFALMALLLAAIGIYGVTAYSVSERTREIGIRMALGAEARSVLTLVIKQGMTLVAIGVASGIAASLAVTQMMKSLLFEVSPTDTTTFAAITLLLTAVALAACYLPARKATKVDPTVALRHE